MLVGFLLAGLVLIPSGWEASGRRLGAARRAPRQPAVVASAGLQEGLQEEVWKAALREAGLEEAQAEELCKIICKIIRTLMSNVYSPDAVGEISVPRRNKYAPVAK